MTMASGSRHPTETRSTIATIDPIGSSPPSREGLRHGVGLRAGEGLRAGDGLRESAFFVVANEREIAGVNHRVQILLGAWQLRRLAETAAELVGALVVATVPFPGRQAHVRLRAYQRRMRCEISGMYPSESALGHAPQIFALSEPSEAVTLLEGRSAAWGREDFTWGRTFWFELELNETS